jgi:hypothetical protein
MQPLLDGKYIRLAVKNIFYFLLLLVGIFSVQTILKDKPLT